MSTLNAILKEIKDVPLNRLEELYQFVHSMSTTVKQTDSLRKKILSFGGSFKDMSDDDFSDFIEHTKKTRLNLFDRNTEL